MLLPRFFLAKNKALIFAAAALALSAVGCGEDAPPYDNLPLRDALRAAPEVMATLPEDSRRDIASRLAEAEHAEEAPTTLAPPEALTLDSLVGAADAAREAEGKDALMLGEISMREAELVLKPQSSAGADHEAPPEVRGKPSAVTAAFEEAALRGRAGKTLQGLLERTHGKGIVRMTGLPVGAIAWQDTVYVNASWLVALAALEEESVAPMHAATPVPASDSPPQGGIEAPAAKPLSVDYNPFKLPANVLECSTQVSATCDCATTKSCSHEPTDQSFADANEECTWVHQAPPNAGALCVFALLEIDNVRQCVQSASPSCGVSVGTREDAVRFVGDADCMRILDTCLATGEPPTTDNAPPASCDACSDCRYCDNKGDDCRECADDCQSFAQLVELCAEICAACASSAEPKRDVEAPFTYASVGATSQCSVRRRVGRSPLPSPVGTGLWLFAPVAYLILRQRRRP